MRSEADYSVTLLEANGYQRKYLVESSDDKDWATVSYDGDLGEAVCADCPEHPSNLVPCVHEGAVIDYRIADNQVSGRAVSFGERAEAPNNIDHWCMMIANGGEPAQGDLTASEREALNLHAMLNRDMADLARQAGNEEDQARALAKLERIKAVMMDRGCAVVGLEQGRR